MIKIDWHQLETNSEGSPQVFYEKFNYQIAVLKFGSFGKFEYFYNTPGSEFYLTLTKDCDELSARIGDVIGWQVKYWFNRSDPENSSLTSGHRQELIEGFKKSLEYKPNLKAWIICTPGLFSNTAPHYPVNNLEIELKHIKPSVNIFYWQKPKYESIFHEDPDCFASIFNHYFSLHYLSFTVFKDHSEKRLDILRKRYDTDLYTPGELDKEVISSIYYQPQLSELLDKIKHSLEEKDKYKNSYLNTVVIKTFLEMTDKGVTDNDKQNIKNLKELTDFLLHVISKLSIYDKQEKTLGFVKGLFREIEVEREHIGKLLKKAKLNYYEDNEIQIDYEFDIKAVHQLLNNLNTVCRFFINKIIRLYRLLFKISRQSYNIFGEAGFGKTNFSCFLTETLLSRMHPVLLIPASEIRETGQQIEKQILSFLGIDSALTFKEFIGILDTIGFRYQIKIPIIIDGLNETQPSASIWYPQLQYIAKEVEDFNNILLITTCRNAYSEQVFSKDNIEDVNYWIKIEGFKDNIEEAIAKYFNKYNIKALNSDFDKILFKNPLFLRIFSIVNKDKAIEINEVNIYDSINSYVETITEKISTQNGAVNPIFKAQTSEGLRNLCIALWELNSRGLPYPMELAKHLDPAYTTGLWQDTKSYKIIDEGLIFRNIHNSQEYAEFTHDLIGGFCIAKEVIFGNKKIDNIIEILKSDTVRKKLTSTDETEKHPLAEDILRAIVYLCPSYTNNEIFELIDNQDVLIASLSMLKLIFSREGGKESFIKQFKDINQNSPLVPHLFESSVKEILDSKKSWTLLEVLVSIIKKMEMYQIDITWSEVIRRKQDIIIPYLYKEIENHEKDAGTHEYLKERILFISLLLSSTNEYLRDKATKSLVTIGKRYPVELIEAFLIIEQVNDLYIIERFIGSIIGVFLQIENKELLQKICSYFEQNYFLKIKTTHVQIMDYIDTLLNYASIHYGYKRTLEWPSEKDLIAWGKDIECLEKVKDNQSAQWGFGPVDYDFSKNNIQRYLSRGYGDLSMTDYLAMIVWKAKDLGYSEEYFEQVDIQINNDKYKTNKNSTQTYATKYSTIAFKELYGHNVIKGYSLNFDDSKGFRVPTNDIDPTFPKLPRKRQIITCCFTPKKNENVQDWIDKDTASLLESEYVNRNIETDGTEWIMLYGRLSQKSAKKSQIDIDVISYLLPKRELMNFVQKFKEQGSFINNYNFDNHYLFAGEIPWSNNVIDDVVTTELNGNKIEIYMPVSSYFRDSQSEFEINSNVYFISKRIALDLDLKMNLDDFNFYTRSKEIASVYIYDNYSKFLFIRADLLELYLRKTEQSLVWVEMGSKYGTLGDNEKYNPSYKDFLTLKTL